MSSIKPVGFCALDRPVQCARLPFCRCRRRSRRACRRGSSPEPLRTGPWRAAACRPRSCSDRLPAPRDPAAQTPLPPIGARLGGRDSSDCQLAGVVRGLANENRCGERVRVAVQADDFSLGRRRGGQVGLGPKRFLGRCLELVDFFMVFFNDVKGKGNRRGQPIGIGPRTEGCSEAFGVLRRPTMVLPPRFNHRLEQLPQRHHRTLDLQPPVRVASTHGFRKGR